MAIDASTPDRFTAAQIAAHCLRDMTFHGFDQSGIQATLDEIKRRADEIDGMTEEERKEFLIQADEVMKRLRSRCDCARPASSRLRAMAGAIWGHFGLDPVNGPVGAASSGYCINFSSMLSLLM